MMAKTFHGLEDVLAEELKQLGAKNVRPKNRLVYFHGDKTLMYTANYRCRTALRILKPILHGNAETPEELYDAVLKVDWASLLTPEDTFAIDSVMTEGTEELRHSNFVSLKVKDAIADQIRRKYNRRPNVDVENPDLLVHIHFFKGRFTISLDSSGEALHRRGYRKSTGGAPINEVLAAGLVMLSGWDRKENFLDGMCGSGTIVIEAAMYANNIAPGRLRKRFGFQGWRDFDAKLWRQIKRDARREEVEYEGKIIGSDLDKSVIQIATQNIIAAKLDDHIILKRKGFQDTTPPSGGGVVIMNPPYDERLEVDDINLLYKEIGRTLKTNYVGHRAWVISSNAEAFQYIGMRPKQTLQLYNGKLECQYCQYEVFEQSADEAPAEPIKPQREEKKAPSVAASKPREEKPVKPASTGEEKPIKRGFSRPK